MVHCSNKMERSLIQIKNMYWRKKITKMFSVGLSLYDKPIKDPWVTNLVQQ